MLGVGGSTLSACPAVALAVAVTLRAVVHTVVRGRRALEVRNRLGILRSVGGLIVGADALVRERFLLYVSELVWKESVKEAYRNTGVLDRGGVVVVNVAANERALSGLLVAPVLSSADVDRAGVQAIVGGGGDGVAAGR